jgi:hypothetical protein
MNLTLALALAAVAAIVALAAHAWWTARRAEPRRAEGVQRVQTPTRIEPTLGAPPLVGEPGMAAFAAATARRAGARIDALIDAVTALALEAPVSGDTVIAHLPASRRAGGKLLLIEGLNAETGEWETPAAGARYGELQAGVQLANRGGALNEIEYSEFVQKVQSFADAVGAQPDFPAMSHSLLNRAG